MPRGFKGIRQASAELEARRQAGPGSGKLFFKLPQSGDTANVWFLDEEPTWVYVHEVPVEGRAWGNDVPCLDQEKEGNSCPGCDREYKRKLKAWINLVWCDAPVYKRDDDGKLVKQDNQPIVMGQKDQIAIWASGVRVFEELDEIDDSYGLTSRQFRVKRKGTGLDTKYTIKPADPDGGKQPLPSELKEMAKEKADLTEFEKLPSYDEFLAKVPGGGGGRARPRDEDEEPTSAPPNPFMGRR